MAIGTARLSSVDFSGLTLTEDSDNDFIGFVFSFQDSSNFYLVYSSKSGSNQGPWKIVRVKSTNPGGLGSGMKSIRKHKIKYPGFILVLHYFIYRIPSYKTLGFFFQGFQLRVLLECGYYSRTSNIF